MHTFALEDDIRDACLVLFGPLFNFSYETLSYLEPSGIKSAFREKAKLYHPDRAMMLGLDEDELSDRFKELHFAYKILLEFNEKKNSELYSSCNKEDMNNRSYYTGSCSVKNEYKRKTREASDFYYSGSILPQRKLRFGEYLYYSKIISWNTLVDALVVQYRSRPKIGNLFLQLNYMSHYDVGDIIKNSKGSELFGEAAVRLGYISRGQLLLALRKQKAIDRPVGKYFIENNLFTEDEIISFLRRLDQHNCSQELVNQGA